MQVIDPLQSHFLAAVAHLSAANLIRREQKQRKAMSSSPTGTQPSRYGPTLAPNSEKENKPVVMATGLMRVISCSASEFLSLMAADKEKSENIKPRHVCTG